jgi:hypothetical protein
VSVGIENVLVGIGMSVGNPNVGTGGKVSVMRAVSVGTEYVVNGSVGRGKLSVVRAVSVGMENVEADWEKVSV